MDLLGDQMTKTLLLTAAAVTALVAAGSAQAGSLSARAGSGAGTVAVAPNNPYKLAQELNFGSGVAASVGQFDTVFTFNTPLQAGSYTVTLAYSGATITAAVPSTVQDTSGAADPGNTTNASGIQVYGTAATPGNFANGANGPSQLTVTGQTSTQITFALQIPAGNSVTSIYASPALLVTGPVSVTAAVTNQVTGAVVDPAVIQPLITTNNRGFAFAARGAITAADGVTFADQAGTDTRVDEGTAGNPFNTLTGGSQVGQVVAAVSGTTNFDTLVGNTTASTAAYKDLNGAAVTLADVTSLSVTTSGILSGLTLTAAGTAGTANAGATAITNTLSTANLGAGANAGVVNFDLTATSGAANAAQIAPTTLGVSIVPTLAAGYAAQSTTTGFFETIQSDGISYIIPWVAGSTLAAQNGNTTVIRVSNLLPESGIANETPNGRVYLQLINPSNAAGVSSVSRTALAGTLTAAGNNELIITSGNLETLFGNFGRGDLRMTITSNQGGATAAAVDANNTLPGGAITNNTAPAPNFGALGASSIVVKRLVQQANGGLTEIEILAGDATSLANAPVLQGVPNNQ